MVYERRKVLLSPVKGQPLKPIELRKSDKKRQSQHYFRPKSGNNSIGLYHRYVIAKHIISSEIPEITLSDSVVNIRGLMEEYNIRHLPVVESGKYLGMVSEDSLDDMETPLDALLMGQVELMDLRAKPGDHIYDVLRLTSTHRLTCIPVADANNAYHGTILIPDLLGKLSTSLGVHQPGGIIVLDVNIRDYALQEIGGVVEGNDAKVLSLQVTPVPNSTQIYVTLKINKPDINPILQTFNRYGYQIAASFQEDVYLDDLQIRYEELMRYMNL